MVVKCVIGLNFSPNLRLNGEWRWSESSEADQEEMNGKFCNLHGELGGTSQKKTQFDT